jgi:hypothetical protein
MMNLQTAMLICQGGWGTEDEEAVYRDAMEVMHAHRRLALLREVKARGCGVDREIGELTAKIAEWGKPT